MTEPRDDYVEEGGDGTDQTLPTEVPLPDPEPLPEDED